MKKLLLLLILTLFTNSAISQEIHSEYFFNKQKGKFILRNCYESERLILHKMGYFEYEKSDTCKDVFKNYIVGDWIIKNDTLFLNFKMCDAARAKNDSCIIELEYLYKIKGKKIIPLNGFEYHSKRTLKRVKIK